MRISDWSSDVCSSDLKRADSEADDLSRILSSLNFLAQRFVGQGLECLEEHFRVVACVEGKALHRRPIVHLVGHPVPKAQVPEAYFGWVHVAPATDHVEGPLSNDVDFEPGQAPHRPCGCLARGVVNGPSFKGVPPI